MTVIRNADFYPMLLILSKRVTGFSCDMFLDNRDGETCIRLGSLACDFLLRRNQSISQTSLACFLKDAAQQECLGWFSYDFERTEIKVMGAVMALLYSASPHKTFRDREILRAVLDIEDLKWAKIAEKARHYMTIADWTIPDTLQPAWYFWREEIVKLGERLISSRPAQKLAIAGSRIFKKTF